MDFLLFSIVFPMVFLSLSPLKLQPSLLVWWITNLMNPKVKLPTTWILSHIYNKFNTSKREVIYSLPHPQGSFSSDSPITIFFYLLMASPNTQVQNLCNLWLLSIPPDLAYPITKACQFSLQNLLYWSFICTPIVITLVYITIISHLDYYNR